MSHSLNEKYIDVASSSDQDHAKVKDADAIEELTGWEREGYIFYLDEEKNFKIELTNSSQQYVNAYVGDTKIAYASGANSAHTIRYHVSAGETLQWLSVGDSSNGKIIFVKNKENRPTLFLPSLNTSSTYVPYKYGTVDVTGNIRTGSFNFVTNNGAAAYSAVQAPDIVNESTFPELYLNITVRKPSLANELIVVGNDIYRVAAASYYGADFNSYVSFPVSD